MKIIHNKIQQQFKAQGSHLTHPVAHTHTQIYIYTLYIVCMHTCVCVCVCGYICPRLVAITKAKLIKSLIKFLSVWEFHYFFNFLPEPPPPAGPALMNCLQLPQARAVNTESTYEHDGRRKINPRAKIRERPLNPNLTLGLPNRLI